MTHPLRPAPIEPRRCHRCHRARRLATVLLLAALAAGASWHGEPARGAARDGAAAALADAEASAVAAAASAVVDDAAAAPQRAGAPASAAADVATRSASEVASSALLLRTVALRSARIGEAYKPLRLVRDEAPPPAVRLDGELPPGMALGADGMLRGTPERTGLYAFRLDAMDAASLRVAHQAYALRVQAAARPASAPAAAAAASAVLRSLGPDESGALVDLHKETPISYQLTAADLATLVPADDAPAADPAGAPASASAPADAASAAAVVADVVEAAARPTVDQLKVQLAPLVDVEFPTLPLFEQAITAGRCAYYRAHVAEQARKRGLADDLSCPPAPASSAHVQAGHLTLPQFYEALLPEDVHAQLVALAGKRHPIEAARPLALGGGRCGCHVAREDETVYGMFPFWLATDTAQDVDFSLFSRIGFLGAMLKDDGTLASPVGWNGEPGGFARAAQRRGTALDLVVYRRDWSALLDLPDARLEEFVRTAARNAVLMVETRFDDASSRWLQPLLLPAWRESEQVYGGLTVFFDDASLEPARRRAFKRFYRGFALRLIAEMAAVGRGYHLGFVVPDAELGDEDTAYGFQQLTDYMETAQPRPSDPNADAVTRQRYRGRTDIRVHYLVTLGAPTGAAKLDVRQRIDRTPLLHGSGRVAFLQGVVPLLFGVRSDKPVPVSPEQMQQPRDDLAYARWNFGGAGLWPAPVAGLGQGAALRDVLAESFQPTRQASFDICALACPNRIPLRLLLEFAILLDLSAILAYGWSCRLRRAVGRRLLLAIWGAGLATLAVGCVFFSCDPLFAELRAGNLPLYVLIGLLCVAGAYATLRPRVEAP